MLVELAIEDLALFERASLRFGPGLDVVTGETGAGKSLLVGALELLLGERPRAALVRKGAKEARVEGRFVVPAGAAELEAWLAEHLPAVLEAWGTLGAGEERELILTRAVTPEGKTRAWVDQRAVTQRTLRELGAHLVEIHGQNEHQRLLEPAEQRRLLDEFGELSGPLAEYRARRADALELARRLARFEADARERRDRLDLLRWQAAELAAAKLAENDPAELEEERALLRDAGRIAGELGSVAAELSESDASALDVLRRACRALEAWEGRLGALAGPAEELRAALAHAEEGAASLVGFLGRLEFSPGRLEDVESRLYAVEELARKHRTGVDGLRELEGRIAQEIARLSGLDVGESELAGELARERARLEAAAAALTKARSRVRGKLEKAVAASLAELGLERASFRVRIEPRGESAVGSPNVERAAGEEIALARRFAPDGGDEVEFLLAANPGEDGQALRVVASGGETARIMLALRTALALRGAIPTLVFDEVDAGVGGRLGPKVGEHLRALAGHGHQVLCVTHLPGIAALADRHFRVEKKVEKGRTRTTVVELEGEARVEEVADMIAGGAAHATARAEARRLLARG